MLVMPPAARRVIGLVMLIVSVVEDGPSMAMVPATGTALVARARVLKALV